MYFWISLCFLVLIFPRVGPAETSKDLIESLPTGSINWTKGVVEAKGLFFSNHPFVQDSPALAPLQQAQRMAAENALHTLERIQVDATRRIADMALLNVDIGARLKKMAENAHLIHEVQLPGGTLEATVRIDLLGGLAQMILPEEIKQLETIKPLFSVSASRAREADNLSESTYSGLIVDARGIGAQPAMAPLLVDENGKQIFGSAFASREYAVQYGMCEYVRSPDSANRMVRIGLQPLMVKGLRTFNERSCDIIISNADAARLRDASAHLDFLKQCRVMIVLD